MLVFILNAGSSSLKYQLMNPVTKEVLATGLCERIGLDGILKHEFGEGQKLTLEVPMPTHKEAIELVLKTLVESEGKVINSIDDIDAIGHRAVHGGEEFASSVMVTPKVIETMKKLIPLAPLHNPANIMGMEICQDLMPGKPNVAVFDTAFHQTMPDYAYMYALPYEQYTKHGIRKYGFHGTSHYFVSNEAKGMLDKKHNTRIIVCHLGNGSSVSAVLNGKCIDTSMGFTPNAGIMMGTRSGDIDYSILSYIMKKEERNLDWMDSQLNKKSGLEGIAGMSDLRDIDRAYEARDAKALLALDMYTDKIVDYVAKYYVKLGGKVDAICFTAGGGENDDIIRKEAINKLYPLGIYLDEEKNKETIVRKGVEGIISSNESKIPVYVLATDEELMIARDTYDLSVEE